MRYQEVTLSLKTIEERDARQAEVDELNAQLEAALKPLIERILVRAGRMLPSTLSIYDKIKRQSPRVTEDDVRRCLDSMAKEGWAQRSGCYPIDSWELFGVHQCIPGNLKYLGEADDSAHSNIYQCQICGEGWKQILGQRSGQNRRWVRGVKLTFWADAKSVQKAS
ncbi:MAG TPA: hypothetical protein VLE72_01165 [Candidatus Saccharimonadales bacterium]|nr:hypothetical protein [Candidatus Saccharimonadales bacterium]